MSVKHNSMLAGSWFVFILVFVGGIAGLLFIAVLIARTSDSNNDKNKNKNKNKQIQSSQVKNIPQKDCGCNGGKKDEEKKTTLIDVNIRANNSQEELVLNLRTVYNTSCQQITEYYDRLIMQVKKSKTSYFLKVIKIQKLNSELKKVIESLTIKLNTDILNIMNSNPQIQFQSLTQPYKKALLVGINYSGTKYELQGCLNDVDLIESKLTTSYSFQKSSIKKLTDDTVMKPTKINIINELTSLLQNATTGDVLFFFYSGHGTYTLDRTGDEKDGRDEMIVAMDMQNILDDDLKQIIKTNLKWGVTLFAMFDSCYSGTVLDLKYQYMENGTNVVSENNKLSETNGNVFMISGCSDWQTSTDAYIKQQFRGAMTWSFLESVKPNISWRTLLQNMRNALKSKGFEQVPQISSGKPLKLDSNFIF
jgi:hypothetical protein